MGNKIREINMIEMAERMGRGKCDEERAGERTDTGQEGHGDPPNVRLPMIGNYDHDTLVYI